MDIPFSSQAQKGKCSHKLRLNNGNSTHDNAKGPVKEGTLKSIVSKYERLSCSTSNTDIKEKTARYLTTPGKLKERGWRAVVGLNRSTRDSHVEQGSNISSEARPVELMEVSMMSSGVPEIFENKGDDGGSKFPAYPVIRGKKEGRKWQSETRLMRGDEELQIPESFGINQNAMIAVEAELRLTVKSPEQRKESLVQMRIRALEQSERSEKIQNPTSIESESHVRIKHNERIVLGFTASNKSQWPSCERKDGDKASLQNPRLLLAPKKLKSLSHEDTATIISISSDPSPKAILSNTIEHPSTPNLATRQHEMTVRRRLEANEKSFKYPLIEGIYDFGTSKKEIPRKTLAPIIKERIHIFERAREDEKTITAGHAPSAIFGLQTNKNTKANDTTNPAISGEVEDVAQGNHDHTRTGPTNPNTNQSKKVMGMFSKCLAERKMPSARTHNFKLSGKYVSAFVQRRKTKEKSISTSWASAAATGSEPSSRSEESIIWKRSRPIVQPREISLNPVSQISSEQQSTSSRLPISWSLQSGSRARTLSDWSHESRGVSALSRSLPTLSDRITQPHAPGNVSLCAMNSRAALVTVTENGGEQVAASQSASIGRNRWGMVGEDAFAKGEARDLENVPLIVQSLAPLSEPKPLRITEVGRMLKMCRLGKSRSRETKKKGGWR